ncbi:MCD, Malonyl-CoA decarboxylase MCD [Nitratireductor sp. CAU 1489]|uniref:MCD, Malonyl-CoA decarboxylase MCD n=1 Tax=Nitratireductor arenosus TaxID=2682096 RepID=A0A844QFK6_9HYPH|nr:malonyl-CoA decarboxylase family protein [Nitratireductor arenosus]MVA96569.1 MCD, Malonyl-CoA decarboxylase MCD [Nitratireductor arenosus]
MNLHNLRYLLATIISARTASRRRRVTVGSAQALVARCLTLASGQHDGTRVVEAEDILAGYRSLDEAAKFDFLCRLATVLEPALPQLEETIALFLRQPGPEAARAVHAAATPPRHLLFSRLNEAEDGTAELAAMRATILSSLDEHTALAPLEADLRYLLSGWFNRAFLVLQRIDWSSPANVLMHIINYEAVHEIKDWDDLRRRIDPPDRACFAFFHPLLADDPLIFVEVALTRDIPTAVNDLLDESRTVLDRENANCAVFYSISNCQPGLRGISFGDTLIKRVITEIASSAPHIDTFVTLSPMPGFRRWLSAQAEANDRAASAVVGALETATERSLSTDDRDGIRNAVLCCGARYLLEARRGDGQPVDSVARFHLGNGARIEQLHWPADRSQKGWSRSFGLMVSYRYEPSELETNRQRYRKQGVVASTATIGRLAGYANQRRSA